MTNSVFAVPQNSPLTTVADVDRDDVRIGVKLGSAYDLYLSRTLQHATVVRGDEGVDIFRAQHLEVAAGIRAPLTAYVADRPDLRVIDERFLQIQQAIGVRVDGSVETITFLRDLVEELKRSGFVQDALDRSGQVTARVAP